MLKSMEKVPKPVKKKDFLQQVIGLSNLGAFSEKRYYDLIAKRLKIPNVSTEFAAELDAIMQTVQILPDGKEKNQLVNDALNLIQKQIPLGFMEMFDVYRYQNALSGPGTQLRNAYGNAKNVLVMRPGTILARGIIDFVSSMITGKPQETYFKQVPVYYKGLLDSIPLAVNGFIDAWNMKTEITHADLKRIRIRQFPKGLTVSARLLEGI